MVTAPCLFSFYLKGKLGWQITVWLQILGSNTASLKKKKKFIAVSVSTGSCNACTDVTKWLSCIVDNVGTGFWKERRMQQIFFAISLVLLYQVWSFVFKLPIMTQTVRPSSVATIKGGSGGSTGAGAPVTLSPDPPVAPPDRESASVVHWQISCSMLCWRERSELLKL